MAKEPWRHGKPTTLVPLGNIDLATQWVPYARKALAELALQGDYRRRMITPIPGVTIHLETRGGIPRIIINAEGQFWWWSYFFGFAPEEEGGGRIAQVVAADVPGLIGAPETGPTNLRGLYKYQEIFSGDKWLGDVTPHIVKTGGVLRVALYEAHDDLSIDEFHVKLGTVQDNFQVQQPNVFYTYTVPLSLPAPVVGPFRLGPVVYPFLYAEEWALLYGNDIGGPSADGGILVRGRYPTPDDDTAFLGETSGVDLSTVADLTHLPGPNPGSGTELRTAGNSRIGFGYWQGNGSFDPLFPPDPEAPLDRDFYFVALVETVDEIPGSSPTRYQQAAVMFRRSIDDPHTNIVLTSWLLDEYIQPDGNENKALYSVYEYEGKLWVIFGRYVSRFPGDPNNKDRDWFFDQYVVDKTTGELLHTQLDCGIRVWAEVADGIWGYEMPAVTFTYSGSTATEAHVEWKLRKYEFGTDLGLLSLFPALDDENNPIELLSITSTIILGSSLTAGRAHDNFNNLILLQH